MSIVYNEDTLNKLRRLAERGKDRTITRHEVRDCLAGVLFRLPIASDTGSGVNSHSICQNHVR